jgi:hypothetical protein
MRTRALVFFVITLLFASPLLLQAQFQESTKEELQMTADPKAPGAAAVYLKVAEVAMLERMAPPPIAMTIAPSIKIPASLAYVRCA